MLKRWLSKVAAPAHHAVSELPGVVRQADVRSLGRSSKGGMQIIGNGTLALTHDALAFYMWRPASELVIPLADVVAVDTATSHAGKRFGTRLLRVRRFLGALS